MKQIMLLLSILIPQLSFATSGNAIIPYWEGNAQNGSSSTNIGTRLTLSNISGTTVSVKIRLYDQDGDIIEDENSSSVGFISIGGGG